MLQVYDLRLLRTTNNDDDDTTVKTTKGRVPNPNCCHCDVWYLKISKVIKVQCETLPFYEFFLIGVN